jgi:hypothetical protein
MPNTHPIPIPIRTATILADSSSELPAGTRLTLELHIDGIPGDDPCYRWYGIYPRDPGRPEEFGSRLVDDDVVKYLELDENFEWRVADTEVSARTIEGAIEALYSAWDCNGWDLQGPED